jgi:hypothetical protein
MKWAAKWSEVQATNNQLMGLHDIVLADKTTLWEFQPVSQIVYLELQQLESFVNTAWQTVVQM